MRAKKILFGMLLFMLVMPCIQEVFPLFEIKHLGGAFVDKPRPALNAERWFSGEFQEEEEHYINDNFGFRNLLVELNNQIQFSLFKQARAFDVVVGKENWLYENVYIKAYYGTDFSGRDSIDEKVRKLRFLQDTLKKKNIDLILVLEPSKVATYPEYIPDHLKQKKQMTNIEYYRQALRKQQVNYLDLHALFVRLKPKALSPLFPQSGIHWTNYGMQIGNEQISQYIEKLRHHKMPHVVFDQVQLSDTMWAESDYDVEKAMNLLFKIPSGKLAYPSFHTVEDTSQKRLKVLTVGDSFNWTIFGAGLSARVTDDPHFWFYYNNMYTIKSPDPTPKSAINLKEEMEKQNVILILVTDSRLPGLGWGFVEDAYKVYTDPVK